MTFLTKKSLHNNVIDIRDYILRMSLITIAIRGSISPAPVFRYVQKAVYFASFNLPRLIRMPGGSYHLHKPNQLNSLIRVEKLHRLKTQQIFSAVSQKDMTRTI